MHIDLNDPNSFWTHTEDCTEEETEGQWSVQYLNVYAETDKCPVDPESDGILSLHWN